MHPVRPKLLRTLAVTLAAATALAGCGVAEDAASGDQAEGNGTERELLAELEMEWMWSPPPPASVGMPAAEGEDVAVTWGRQRLVVLDRAGALRWESPRQDLRDVAPVFTSQLVLAPTEDGLAAFDRRSGRARWEAKLGDRTNTPAISGATAVVTTWEGNLAGIDLRDGKVRWQTKLGGNSLGPPAASGTTVVATFATQVKAGAVAVDAASGRQRWAVALPAGAAGGTSAPAIVAVPGAGDVAVVVAADLAAHGLSLDNGAERWRSEVEGAGSPEVPPLALAGGKVLAAHQLGGMAMLDARDGTKEWAASSDQAAVRGGPAGPGPNGWFAMPLYDGSLMLAQAGYTEFRDPPGLTTGVARGPGNLLLIGVGQGTENGLNAAVGW